MFSRAEKRAAWRAARLKSLEQDAIQAQIMIQSLAHNDSSGDDLLHKKRKSDDTSDGKDVGVSIF